MCSCTYFPFLKIWNEFVTCDWHSSSVKVFSDVQILYLYLVHICLFISHGNCFCAPLKWTFRTYDSQWCKHLQTRCRSHSVHSLILCCFASFPYVSSEVLIIFYQKQLLHWLCDSVKYTWGVSPIWIEPVLITMFG